nr:MAG TPA: hypothetical protein [Caudoviricetes sp.]
MVSMNQYSKQLDRLWYKHFVEVSGEVQRTAFGVKRGQVTMMKASINTETRTVSNEHGDEVTVAATVKWRADGILPKPGQTVTLPEEFGVPGAREIVTAKRAYSGTGLTPDHVEVTLK